MGAEGSKLDGKPVVVVVGGGYAGKNVAQKLDSQLNVVVLDKKNYFFHNLGCTRAAVQPDFTTRLVVPYNKMIKNGAVLQANVTNITPESVTVAERQTPVKFDYLVIATGSSYAFPFKFNELNRDDLQKHYDECAKAVEEANSIAIIGGGPVGCEVCGEISYKYPDKTITLIHSGERLCNDSAWSPKVGDGAKERLERQGKNLTILLNHKAELPEEMKGSPDSYLTKKVSIRTTTPKGAGDDVEADVTFVCVGLKVRNQPFEDSFGLSNGKLEVNKCLQVGDHNNIFAIGDCAAIDEPAMAYYAAMQGDHAASNILRLVKGETPEPYKQHSPNIILPLGPELGVSQLPIGVRGSFSTRMIKGKDMFTKDYWGQMNSNPDNPDFKDRDERAVQQVIDKLDDLDRKERLADSIFGISSVAVSNTRYSDDKGLYDLTFDTYGKKTFADPTYTLRFSQLSILNEMMGKLFSENGIQTSKNLFPEKRAPFFSHSGAGFLVERQIGFNKYFKDLLSKPNQSPAGRTFKHQLHDEIRTWLEIDNKVEDAPIVKGKLPSGTVHHFKIGELDAIVFSDNAGGHSFDFFFKNGEEDVIQDELLNYPDQVDEEEKTFCVGYSVMYVKTETNQILIDAGLGRFAQEFGQPEPSQLAANIQKEGIDPKEIDHVILTHAHPDHIGTLVTSEKEVFFPNATIVLGEDELKLWTSENPDLCSFVLGTQMEKTRDGIANNVKETLNAYDQSKIKTINEEEEILPNIRVVQKKGHTDGSLMVEITSGDTKLLAVGDAIFHPIYFHHPEWGVAFHHHTEEAAQVQHELIERVVDKNVIVYPSHFLHPSVGYLTSGGPNGRLQWTFQEVEEQETKGEDVHRFELGEFQCTVLNDRNVPYPINHFFKGASPHELEDLLKPYQEQITGENGDMLTLPSPVLHIKTPNNQVIIDAGLGNFAAELGLSGSKIWKKFSREGINPDEIDTVIITHAHPENIGCLLQKDGTEHFPNADIVIGRDELALWLSEEPDLHCYALNTELESKLDGIADHVKKTLGGVNQMKFKTIRKKQTIVEGITAVQKKGHTDGSLIIEVESQGQKLIAVGDAIIHPLYLGRPEWGTFYHHHPEAACSAQKAIVDMVDQDTLLYTSSFAFPSVGNIIKEDGNIAWKPQQHQPESEEKSHETTEEAPKEAEQEHNASFLGRALAVVAEAVDEESEDDPKEDTPAEEEPAEEAHAKEAPAEEAPAEEAPAEEAPAEEAPAEEAPAEEAPAEEAPAEEAPAEEAPAEEVPAEEAPAEEAPAEEAPAEEAPAEEALAEEAPAEEAPAEEAPAEEEPAEEAAAEDAPAEDAPAEDAPAEDAPAEEAPAEEAPAEDAPAEEAPAEEAPAEEAPAEEAPAEDAPAEEAPAEEAPAEEAPAEEAPADEAPAEEVPADDKAAEVDGKAAPESKDEPSADEQAKDEQAKDEPAKEEPAKEEPEKPSEDKEADKAEASSSKEKAADTSEDAEAEI